jgi:hypothetical protein
MVARTDLWRAISIALKALMGIVMRSDKRPIASLNPLQLARGGSLVL